MNDGSFLLDGNPVDFASESLEDILATRGDIPLGDVSAEVRFGLAHQLGVLGAVVSGGHSPRSLLEFISVSVTLCFGPFELYALLDEAQNRRLVFVLHGALKRPETFAVQSLGFFVAYLIEVEILHVDFHVRGLVVLDIVEVCHILSHAVVQHVLSGSRRFGAPELRQGAPRPVRSAVLLVHLQVFEKTGRLDDLVLHDAFDIRVDELLDLTLEFVFLALPLDFVQKLHFLEEQLVLERGDVQGFHHGLLEGVELLPDLIQVVLVDLLQPPQLLLDALDLGRLRVHDVVGGDHLEVQLFETVSVHSLDLQIFLNRLF